MSSDSDDLSSDSNSSSISSNSIEYHEWESRVVQYNQRTDRIFEDVIINYPNLFIQDQTSRARRAYRDREREQGEALLMADYFVDNPTFDEVIFRRRFRMRKHLFVCIVDAVTANNAYFQQRRDATGRQSLSSLQKCTGAMRVLAYGISFDAVDEYLRVSGALTRKSLMSFVQGVISCFGDEYLRRPNEDDLARLLNIGEQRGFPGMIGSIDRMHWQWKNCPKGWAGQYAGRNGKPTIILEAVASPIFNDVLEGRAPKVSYVVNEAVRKDVERAFGVLQARFAFLRHPCLIWDYEQMGQIMIACIIMHNMIVEDERETYRNYDPSEFFNDTHTNGNDDVVEYSTERIADLRSYMRNREQLRNREAHSSLQNDLIEHIWQKFGDDN
ncbi:putative nuclease HARBI1 [Tanacetum coccineum]|uniref:Nuclease HARBI1 n=1 Tax=Tanacetum coccineum TaxID=301880 RepID=A0ABQ5IJN5_9ASTR